MLSPFRISISNVLTELTIPTTEQAAALDPSYSLVDAAGFFSPRKETFVHYANGGLAYAAAKLWGHGQEPVLDPPHADVQKPHYHVHGRRLIMFYNEPCTLVNMHFTFDN